ncbi:hypothetical protein [Mycobacterium sp.]|uniref:PPW family C-terminal domain-containing PPE protein n=1 Tax=Mycobacterium sp. TaxID=1785 RepID=UPI002D7E46C8|nr:hypothetical protein [Mycobacterium sp.]
MASRQGARPLGFAGAGASRAMRPPSGLTTPAGDAFGGGPSLPMLPGGWHSD